MSVEATLIYPLDETDYNADGAQLFHSTRTSGVFSSNEDFIATPAGGMNIILSAGQGWLRLERFKGVAFSLSSDATFQIDISDAILHRIDRLVFRYDYVLNRGLFVLRKGTPASTPHPPALQNIDGISRELGLKDIHVNAGVSEITAANIEDLIPNPELCGVMADGVTRLPTEQLQQQSTATIQLIRDELDRLNAGTEVMLKTEFAPNATAQITGNTLAITSTYINPSASYTVLFDAPEDFNAERNITANGVAVELQDLNNEPIADAWKVGSPIQLFIRGDKAFFKSGGAGQNFKVAVVADYDMLPIAASKNRMHVISDIPLPSSGETFEIGSILPSAPQPIGKVFIRSVDKAGFAFNGLRGNNIWNVYPEQAFQWDGATWQPRDAYIDRFTTWEQFSFARNYLYNNGDNVAGFVQGPHFIGSPTLTFTPYLGIRLTTNTGGVAGYFRAQRDITADETISVNVTMNTRAAGSNGMTCLGISTKAEANMLVPSDFARYVVIPDGGATGEFSIDVSGFTGTYYVFFGTHRSAGSATPLEIRADKIWAV